MGIFLSRIRISNFRSIEYLDIVAVTRAKRLCYMTYPAKKKMPWGDIKNQVPSRYIKDIVV